MPVVFRHDGYIFHFYANEGDPREPAHVHVRKDRADAKFWLRPDVSVAYNRGFPARVLKQLVSVIEDHRDEIESAWNDFFA
jgi:hypothetical protein